MTRLPKTENPSARTRAAPPPCSPAAAVRGAPPPEDLGAAGSAGRGRTTTEDSGGSHTGGPAEACRPDRAQSADLTNYLNSQQSSSEPKPSDFPTLDKETSKALCECKAISDEGLLLGFTASEACFRIAAVCGDRLINVFLYIHRLLCFVSWALAPSHDYESASSPTLSPGELLQLSLSVTLTAEVLEKRGVTPPYARTCLVFILQHVPSIWCKVSQSLGLPVSDMVNPPSPCCFETVLFSFLAVTLSRKPGVLSSAPNTAFPAQTVLLGQTAQEASRWAPVAAEHSRHGWAGLSLQDLSSPRGGTCAPAVGARFPNPRTTKELPQSVQSMGMSGLFWFGSLSATPQGLLGCGVTGLGTVEKRADALRRVTHSCARKMSIDPWRRRPRRWTAGPPPAALYARLIWRQPPPRWGAHLPLKDAQLRLFLWKPQLGVREAGAWGLHPGSPRTEFSRLCGECGFSPAASSDPKPRPGPVAAFPFPSAVWRAGFTCALPTHLPSHLFPTP
ncbi:hypothetical protein MJT46_012763 [Ovis ammon polii x Ovis aries]|nr:hypothetical protein MJT46_012763 [Ovis ammon polii x Ovis aries]